MFATTYPVIRFGSPKELNQNGSTQESQARSEPMHSALVRNADGQVEAGTRRKACQSGGRTHSGRRVA